MSTESPLKNKLVLVVDDEPDILESVGEELEMCILHKAKDYETALQYLLSYTYDIVILDIMGVNGFELLRNSVSRGFPTVMLTAHALTPDALKKSIKLGAVSFLPKEKIGELQSFLEDVVLGTDRPGASSSTNWEIISTNGSVPTGRRGTGFSRNLKRN